MLSFSCLRATTAAPPPAAPPAATPPATPAPTLGGARADVVLGFLADEEVVEVLPVAATGAGPAETPAAFLRATASYS